MTPTQELDEKLSMDSHAASYTGVLHSFFAAAITAHLMLEDWRLEPFNHLWLALHPLLLQWYHQRSHSQHMQAMKPLAQVPLPQALQQQQEASCRYTWALLSCRWANGTWPGTGCIAIVGFSCMSSLLLQSFIFHLLCSAQPFLCFRSGHRWLWAIASLWPCTVTNRLWHWTSSISWSCSIWSCSIWNWGYSCSDGMFVGAPCPTELLLKHPPAIFPPHRFCGVLPSTRMSSFPEGLCPLAMLSPLAPFIITTPILSLSASRFLRHCSIC